MSGRLQLCIQFRYIVCHFTWALTECCQWRKPIALTLHCNNHCNKHCTTFLCIIYIIIIHIIIFIAIYKMIYRGLVWGGPVPNSRRNKSLIPSSRRIEKLNPSSRTIVPFPLHEEFNNGVHGNTNMDMYRPNWYLFHNMETWCHIHHRRVYYIRRG